jgi:hypothetical protein
MTTIFEHCATAQTRPLTPADGFARDALVHLNAIVCSVAAVRERPDPPSVLDGPGLVTSAIA